MASFDVDRSRGDLGWLRAGDLAGDIEQIWLRSDEPRWLTEMRKGSLGVLHAASTAGRFTDVLPGLDLRHELEDHLLPDAGTTPRAEESDAVVAEQGVVFCDIGTAVRDHPHLVEEYFGTVVEPDHNEFAALNTAFWSGGSFIYVPPGVAVELPLQAMSRIVSEPPGRFERTLIVAGEGSRVSYISGCSAPVYTRRSLHSAVVEVVVEPHARVTCTTIQNWSSNVHQVVTKRARVEAHGHMEWIDGNIGSNRSVDHSAVHLVGEGATGEVFSVATARNGQSREANVELLHAAPNTTSRIVSKAISVDGGTATCHSRVRVDPGAVGARSDIACEGLDVGADRNVAGTSTSSSTTDTDVAERDARIHHEATVSEISAGQRFSLMSRGLSEEEAVAVIVTGFVDPITRLLPLEYAVEWSRLIALAVEGSVG